MDKIYEATNKIYDELRSAVDYSSARKGIHTEKY